MRRRRRKDDEMMQCGDRKGKGVGRRKKTK